jgi:hypothetical protein
MFLPLEESFPKKIFENFFTWVAPLLCSSFKICIKIPANGSLSLKLVVVEKVSVLAIVETSSIEIEVSFCLLSWDSCMAVTVLLVDGISNTVVVVIGLTKVVAKISIPLSIVLLVVGISIFVVVGGSFSFPVK